MFRSEISGRDGDAHRRRNRWWNVNFLGSLVIIAGMFVLVEVSFLGWSLQRSLVVTGINMTIGVGGWAILGLIVECLNNGERK